MSKEFTPTEKNHNADNVSDWFRPQRHSCEFVSRDFGTLHPEAFFYSAFGFTTWMQSVNAVAYTSHFPLLRRQNLSSRLSTWIKIHGMSCGRMAFSSTMMLISTFGNKIKTADVNLLLPALNRQSRSRSTHHFQQLAGSCRFDLSTVGPTHPGMKEFSDAENRKVINNFKHSSRKCGEREEKLGAGTTAASVKTVVGNTESTTDQWRQ